MPVPIDVEPTATAITPRPYQREAVQAVLVAHQQSISTVNRESNAA